jgi:hypothetical protein
MPAAAARGEPTHPLPLSNAPPRSTPNQVDALSVDYKQKHVGVGGWVGDPVRPTIQRGNFLQEIFGHKEHPVLGACIGPNFLFSDNGHGGGDFTR